ncbi:ATP synthase subunit I [Pseudorhodobacter sp.]|uniref:N-ATPase subunit AtpR n=1 Tax=Pseudorhodobacter sp. TaxID=1934400 RepID=UPI002AFFFE1B|nr:ATP synthase subunit I [Pseudorhodobacter sp.]
MMAFDWLNLDWANLGFGAALGAVAAGLFFAGLAWSMRLALRAARPMPVLLISAALRIAALLAVGWLVAGQGVWAFLGFALAFFLIRLGAISLARLPGDQGAKPCR